MTPLCFILMPFGKKPDASGRLIDFDEVYKTLIKPAIEDAGLEPLRADEEMVGGIIHKPMFERLVLCEYAVADLTLANANVFYELGVRHAALPRRTVLIFDGDSQLPFDVRMLRALPYSLGADGMPSDVDADRAALKELLDNSRGSDSDSPLYQLLDGYPDIDHSRTDIFRQQVDYSKTKKSELASARREGLASIQHIEQGLGRLDDVEAGVVIDLFLSYRAVEAWPQMIRLVGEMDQTLAATVLVQEQLALALNRNQQGEEAERVLLDLLQRRGPSSETYGILGRVYKDRWKKAQAAQELFLAQGLLDKAINAYLAGFETDWRDAYPGINAVTLMEFKQPVDERQKELLPLVRYAARRRVESTVADYWDHATLLEAAVLEGRSAEAMSTLADALALAREQWEPKTTADNLQLILNAREERAEEVDWLVTIIEELRKCEQRLTRNSSDLESE